MLRFNSELALAACGEGVMEEAGLGKDEDGVGLVCLGVSVEMLPECEYGIEREVLQAED
jgi:hypothetical protein